VDRAVYIYVMMALGIMTIAFQLLICALLRRIFVGGI